MRSTTRLIPYQRENGAAAGRGNYDSATDSARILSQARTGLKRMIGAGTNSELVFTFNGTDGLNLCLFGFLKPGDHVITSVAEHNSILRPLASLKESREVEVTFADTDDDGVISMDSVQSAIRPTTRLIAVTHASNVTAAIQPIDKLAELAHSGGAKILVDAAQTIGHHNFGVADLGIDILAASGHKGLMGPLGTGFVYLAEGISPLVQPFRFGGTGINSQSDQQPAEGPERFESGNLNMPGIAGLLAATEFHELDKSTEQDFTERVLTALKKIPGVSVVGPKDPDGRVELVSLTLDGYDSHDAAAALNAAAQIETRAGLHCAPKMHERLGVPGTLRASWGRFTTADEIESFLQVIGELVGDM